MEAEVDAQGDAKDEGEGEYLSPGRSWWPIGAPQLHVSYWVKLAEARFSESFAQILKEWRLIPSEWAVLRELYRPGRRSPVELGQVIGMSKGGASKLIDRLVKKELVRKEVAQFDRRFRAVWLTEHGREWVCALASLEKDLDREFFLELRGGGRYRLTESLKRILTAQHRKHMKEWVLLQSDDYCGISEAEEFWNELCSEVAAAAAFRSSG